MKTLFSTVLILALAIGFLIAASPGRAEAWHRGPAVSFSVIVPPFGVSVGAPPPYYPAPVYVAPPYPVYERVYPYYGYYGYGPYFRFHHRDHRDFRGERHWRDRDRGHERGHWRY